jgi:phosphomannomutase
MMIKINPTIFRDYDIRGIYPSELNEDTYYVIGRAMAKYLEVPEIAVGYDTRLSSPSLFKSIVCGITDQGTNVVDLGLISTEIHNFASGKYRFPANIIISASHNPAEYNGLKTVKAGVIPLHGGYGIPEVKKLAIEQDFKDSDKKGKIRKMDIMNEWIKHTLTFVKLDNLKKLKVVVDAGNGMGGISWEKLIGKTNIEIIPLYFEPDGHFPHHLPDPLKEENLKDLQKKVIETKADLGLAIDGDADRMFAVDEKGISLSGTITTAIISKHLLTKFGPNPVLYNTACGRIVPETVLSLGGKPIRVRVGHSFIKEYMKKYKAIFAGEHSGHFYFRDNYNAESSLIAGLLMLEYISCVEKPTSQIRNEFSKYPSSSESSFKVSDVERVMKMLEDKYSNADSKDFIDGLTIWYKDWWFNVRPSKTEPLLRLNLEADTKELMKEKLEEVKYYILGSKYKIPNT